MHVTISRPKPAVGQLVAISKGRAATLDGRIREIRERARLSQAELADALGVQPATVSRWENGQRLPRGLSAERLSNLLRELENALAAS